MTNGTSSRLRKKALQDPTYTLTNMLIDGRKYATSSAQADGIEEQFKTKPNENINTTTIATPTKKKCYYCGFDYPHEKRPCPAKNSVRNYCGIQGHFANVCRSRVNKEQGKDGKKGFSSPDKRRQTRRQGTKKQAKAVEASQRQTKDESSEDDYVYTVSKEQNKKTHANVTVNGQNVHFLIDTGATVDIIDANTFEKLRQKVSLQKSTTKIYAYGFQTPLPLKGQFQETLESKKRYTVSQIYVIDGAGGNLLSAKTAQDLAFVQLANKISSLPDQEQTDHHKNATQSPPPPTTRESNPVQNNTSMPRAKDQKIQEIINKYSTVFEGQGKLNNQQIKLHIRDDVNPVMQPQRRIPYHIRQDVSKELKKLQDQDIIEKVTNQPTPWISPIVATPKKDGGIRICVDMREANQAIERERHTMPTLQDFKAEVRSEILFKD